MSILPKLSYRCYAIPIKIPVEFVRTYTQADSKIYIENWRNYKSQNILKRKKNDREIIFPDLRLNRESEVLAKE